MRLIVARCQVTYAGRLATGLDALVPCTPSPTLVLATPCGPPVACPGALALAPKPNPLVLPKLGTVGEGINRARGTSAEFSHRGLLGGSETNRAISVRRWGRLPRPARTA